MLEEPDIEVDTVEIPILLRYLPLLTFKLIYSGNVENKGVLSNLGGIFATFADS